AALRARSARGAPDAARGPRAAARALRVRATPPARRHARARDQGRRIPGGPRRAAARGRARAADALDDDRPGSAVRSRVGGRTARDRAGEDRMRDQAQGLRAMPARERPAVPVAEARSLVVGGGKGGVGVSVLSVLLASAMARAGRRTLLMDATL